MELAEILQLPCTWIHCSLHKKECRHESEIYNYQRIQLSNIELMMASCGVSLTWIDCNSINIPAAKRLSVGWAAATQNLSCSLLNVWTPVLKRKDMKKLHNSTKWTQHQKKHFSVHIHVHFWFKETIKVSVMGWKMSHWPAIDINNGCTNQGVHYALEIREFSVNCAEFSGKRSVAYDYYLFRRGASFKIFSCNVTPFSCCTRIPIENPD